MENKVELDRSLDLDMYGDPERYERERDKSVVEIVDQAARVARESPKQ